MRTPTNPSASTDRWRQVKRLVDEALDLSGAERAAFLDRSCGSDESLRGEVEAFLEREARLGGFLSRPLFSLRRQEGESDEGRRLGPYRLVRRLGAGGMGTVYLAQRDDGELRQQVAVKLLKRGLDTGELLHRFQTERQILADLAHPYVARLLDAGTAEDGRPFLVMEYVEGEPIDLYCDTRRLGTRERVALFRRVCAAVHFAHQNLVVHRDLKPANVLVAADGTPKLLDFGIAKLLHRDSGRPAVTSFQERRSADGAPAQAPSLGPEASSITSVRGVAPMTSLYASPEQVAGGPITTASDVYALGIVLYKLLTGHLPWSGKAVLRMGEPPPVKPSLAVGRRSEVRRSDGSVDVLTPESVSRVRDGDPRRLARRLRGDLDHIVVKALEPEPERRFSSADQLSEDLRRHLERLPVRSRPGAFLYRAGKFVYRNALGSGAAALVAVLVLGSGVVIARQNVEIERERDRAESVKTFLEDFLRAVPERGETITVREVLDAGAWQLERDQGEDPKIRAELLDTVGGVYRDLTLYDSSRPLLEEALDLRHELYGEDHVLTAETLQNLASLERSQGRPEKAERLMRRALEIQRRGFPEGHRDLARALNNLALALRAKGELEEAEELARESLAMKKALFGPEHPEVTAPLNTLATVLRNQGELKGSEGLVRESEELYQESEELYRECLRLRRLLERPGSPNLANVLNGLAGLLVVRGDPGAAVTLYQEALEIRRQFYAGDHSKLAASLNNLGRAHILLGEAEPAKEVLEEGLAMARRLSSAKLTAVLTQHLAWANLDSGDFLACEELSRSALAMYGRLEDVGNVAESQSLLGGCLLGSGNLEEAESFLSEGYRSLVEGFGEGALETRLARERLSALNRP